MATHALDIRIKRVYEHSHEGDGTRVLVDRLWPRGLSKDAAELSLWLKDVAPSAELRTWFGHDPKRYAEFSTRYRAELDDNPEAVTQIEELARKGTLTLLYGAHDEEHNQARVLAEYLREHLKGKRAGK